MWAKFAAEGWSHPKVLKAGNAAYGAFVRAVQWSSEHLTEGRIPDDVALLIASRKTWARLVNAKAEEDGVGLAIRTATGYQIHDFLEWNPSAAQVKARRASDRARQLNARQKRDLSRRDTGVSHSERHAVSHTAPSPSPSPSPPQAPPGGGGADDLVASQPRVRNLPLEPPRAREMRARVETESAGSPVDPVPTTPPEPEAAPPSGGPAVAQKGSEPTPAGHPPATDTPAPPSTRPHPPGPAKAPADDLLAVLHAAAAEGHPWCSQLQARIAERGYRLTPGERRRLTEIRDERSTPSTGPPRRNGRNLDLVPVAEGGRCTLQQPAKPGEYNWLDEEAQYGGVF